MNFTKTNNILDINLYSALRIITKV